MVQSKKSLLMQARLYRFFSILFVVTGLFIFISIYMRNMEGRLLDALSEPLTVLTMVFPFAPAIVLSLLAKSSENKYLSTDTGTDKKKIGFPRERYKAGNTRFLV